MCTHTHTRVCIHTEQLRVISFFFFFIFWDKQGLEEGEVVLQGKSPSIPFQCQTDSLGILEQYSPYCAVLVMGVTQRELLPLDCHLLKRRQTLFILREVTVCSLKYFNNFPFRQAKFCFFSSELAPFQVCSVSTAHSDDNPFLQKRKGKM